MLSETLRVHDRKNFVFHFAYFVSYKGQLGEELRKQGAPVKCFEANSAPAILAKTPALAAFVRREGFDLIHCHLPLSAVVGRLVGRYANVPVVYTEHNKQERYHQATRLANLATMGLNAKVLAVSDDVRQSLLHHWDGPKERVRVLINGVNTERFNPDHCDRGQSRLRLGLPADVPIVGTVCVFRVQKRLNLWMELARQVKAEIPTAHFVVIGDGPTESQVKGLAREYGLENSITFPGRLEEVRPWMSAMDVYLMTSEFEGLPIAMLEAMSMGLPIVATAAGGIPEAVTDGREGHLTSVDAWEGLKQPLLKLVRNPALRWRQGEAARKRVMTDFSIQTMANELEAVYREVIDTHKHGRV